MIGQNLVGQVLSSSGTTPNSRGGITAELIVGDAHARYFEAVRMGRAFWVANQSGVTTQAGLSATTPVLTLANQAGSGVNLILWFAGLELSVVNVAAAIVWLAANSNAAAAAVTGTPAVPVNALIGSTVASAAKPFTAATLPAAPTAICSLGVGLTGAITTAPGQATFGRWFDGSIVVAPGGALSFQTSTASGASSSFGTFAWEEVPIVS